MHYYLFIKRNVSLDVSSSKCSSSGGYTVCMQHIVLSLSTRVRGGLSVHRHATTNCLQSDSTIYCMYTVYPPEDEHLRLETCRGT
jgi:hypothetical protein